MGIYISLCDSDVEVWLDDDFSGNWFPEKVKDDSDTICSRLVFVVSYLGCPVMWKSKLYTEISLSSTETQCIIISQTLLKTIPIIEPLK